MHAANKIANQCSFNASNNIHHKPKQSHANLHPHNIQQSTF
ncbi:hypothetical protein HMPREF3216_00207 [Gardnerella vaginalis]|uniref:Uncharacterized protein n=1 Tax=Gardnerella vaginalis TaxID=2702 RepID=A0A133NRY3_GARVA|nr:hypothetical protein HMPREF3216_00207 [Gardnerella vaginalis]